jgi:hypothetical protein
MRQIKAAGEHCASNGTRGICDRRAVLPDLAHQDIEKLGVLLGHRRERAIASDVPGLRPCKRAEPRTLRHRAGLLFRTRPLHF